METAEGGRVEGGSLDTEKNLVIGRLSEDRGYCIPTEDLQLQHYKRHTARNFLSSKQFNKTTKGGRFTINSTK